jgi:hypothetical protein
MKSILGFFVFTVAILSVPQFARAAQKIKSDQIFISTEINSTVDDVWKTMIDFQNYGKWNRWYQIRGEPIKGALIQAYSGSGVNLDLQITKIEDNAICWVDVTWFTKFGLGGWRCRSVKPNPNGLGVIFINYFEFTGPMRFILKIGARRLLIDGMKMENQNLKDFIENGQCEVGLN